MQSCIAVHTFHMAQYLGVRFVSAAHETEVVSFRLLCVVLIILARRTITFPVLVGCSYEAKCLLNLMLSLGKVSTGLNTHHAIILGKMFL
jgi:hypothetical protein